jgi:AcrR family transcriptional regulator
MKIVKRKYLSPRRHAQAEGTRRRLIDCARSLFAKGGYSGTTIEAIARAAEVAVPTFYLTFGSKRAILFALLDQLEEDADQVAAVAEIRAATGDARRQLDLCVAFAVRLFSKGADVLEAVRSAAGTEAELADFWRHGESRRKTGQAPLIEDWTARKVLRRDVSPDDAASTLWAMTGPDVFRLFVKEQGWSIERFQSWLGDALARLLFEEQPLPSRRNRHATR